VRRRPRRGTEDVGDQQVVLHGKGTVIE
jgi:hypothetical protein